MEPAMKVSHCLLLISVSAFGTLAGGAALAAGESFSEIEHQVSSFRYAASGRFATVDADGDGISDLVFNADTGPSLEPWSVLFVLGKVADGSIAFKQAKLVDNNDGITSRTLVWSVGGSNHILTVGHSGTVRDYAGWPLEEQRSFA